MATEQWAQKTLPKEIWEIVLKNLKGDSESLLHCSKTCQTWNELLEKDKVNLLFPMVVPVLEKYISGNDVLACRLVCKKWRDEVDQFRQSAVQQWTPNFDDKLIDTVWRLTKSGSGSYQGRNVFTRRDQIEAFVPMAWHYNGNPFPTTSVIYQCFPNQKGDGEIMDIVQRALHMNYRLNTLLAIFGRYISDFSYISGGAHQFVGVPAVVSELLGSLPNLRSFSLHHLNAEHVMGVVFEDETLPNLPHLKSLHLNMECLNVANADGAVADNEYGALMIDNFAPLLVAYGPQLEQLETDSQVFCTDYTSPVTRNPDKFVSLQRLKIRNIGRRVMERDTIIGLYFRLWHLKLPSLQRVSLHFHPNSERIELWRLFRLLNCWSSTLIEAHFLVELPQLQIYSPFYSGLDSASNPVVLEKELGLLRVFGVCYSILNTPILLWVVKKFPNLERLELHGFTTSNKKQGVGFSETVSDGNSVNDDKSEHGHLPPPLPPSSPPNIPRDHQVLLYSLWKKVATLTEIIVWPSDSMSADAPKVLHWKRVEPRKLSKN